MIFFSKQKRELKQKADEALELVKLQNEKIAQLESLNRFVYVPPIMPDDERAYQHKIAALSTDPMYVFYFSRLQYDYLAKLNGIDKNGEETNYIRGALSNISTIIADAMAARKRIDDQKRTEAANATV